MHSIGRFSSLASDLVVQTAQSLVVQALECLRTLQQHLSAFAWRTSNGLDGSDEQLAGYQWKCQCSHCPEMNTLRYTDRFPICSPELRSKEPGPLGATEDHWPLPSGTSCWRPELSILTELAPSLLVLMHSCSSTTAYNVVIFRLPFSYQVVW